MQKLLSTLEPNARSSDAHANHGPIAPHYATSLEHVCAELQRVHMLVRGQIAWARRQHTGEEELQGLVNSEQEVDEMLDREPSFSPSTAATKPVLRAEMADKLERLRTDIAARKAESSKRGILLRLAEIERLFSLDRFEIDCLLVCLAAQLDVRYERLYAYLQDDVTRKRPSVGLLLDLLCPSFDAKLHARRYFRTQSPLIDYKILIPFEDAAQHPATLLGQSLRVDERIVNYILGSDELDPSILPFTRCVKPGTRLEGLVLPDETKDRLSHMAKTIGSDPPIFYFQGPYGTGKQAAAEAISHELQLSLLLINLESLLSGQLLSFETDLQLIMREARLRGDALYFAGFALLQTEERVAQRNVMLAQLRHCSNIVFIASEMAWQPTSEMRDVSMIRVEFRRPNYANRVVSWQSELGPDLACNLDVAALANKFRFTSGEITDAASTARSLARSHGDSDQPTLDELYEACRLHSSRKLFMLGRKIKPRHTWQDLVLPEDRLRQLQEICNSVRYRSLVFEQWGFDRKLSLGKGLNMLFAGPSGTGKTMAAEIMAGELELDIYKIDLSTVVSKYIGETEKNLARIFAEAEASNAILFFDEADALFGKRSEVRDSHDRYANIEINYLLQKMEEHEGVVILATNFRKNMDHAFVRRMHFTVEFPLPCEADRRRIWEQIWPKETPQSSDLDFDFMARRFEIPGGNIRNVAVAAAFLAASDGGVVSMAHLLHGTRREYQKMGKVVMQGEFQ
jgi:DNA polymerase III delta prime subunit